MTFRERALRIAISQIGVHEVGFNNRGPKVDEYQRVGAAYVGWVGFAWCAAFVSYCFEEAGYDVTQIPLRASVGYFEKWARERGYIVDRPLRGDVFHWRIDGDNWPDHTGFVEKVLGRGPMLWLQTVEGNTSDGSGGSQDDGGGVYRRRRFVAKSRIVFTRIPGDVKAAPPVPKPKPKPKDTFWAWARWYLGRSEFKQYGPRASAHRPDVPARVPTAWWGRLKKHTKGA